MNVKFRLAAIALAAAAVATPALAWKLVKHGEQVIVAKSAMVVTAADDWNRQTSGYVKNTELWTLDGVPLNELYLVSGIPAGGAMFYELDKKDNPLPKFSDKMLLTDIPDFIERTWRVGRQAVVFKTLSVEPAKMGGKDAIRMKFEYVRDGNRLSYKGEALAAIVDNQLRAVMFEGTSLYYYDRDIAKAEAVMGSVTFREMPKQP